MNFDVDASGSLEANEGANVTNSLDVVLTGTASVFDEIKSRGFSAPSMY
jgi:hypothetical protein